MSKPVFHPALDDMPDELETMFENAAALGVSVEEFAFRAIHEVSRILVREGSSSHALNAAMEQAYAARVSAN
jgi:hypothetical protein